MNDGGFAPSITIWWQRQASRIPQRKRTHATRCPRHMTQWWQQAGGKAVTTISIWNWNWSLPDRMRLSAGSIRLRDTRMVSRIPELPSSSTGAVSWRRPSWED